MFKKLTIVGITLLGVILLTGCMKADSSLENKTVVNTEQDTNNSDNTSSEDTKVDVKVEDTETAENELNTEDEVEGTNSVDTTEGETEGNSKTDKENNTPFVIKPIDRAPAFDLKEHPYLTGDLATNAGGLPTLGPFYQKDYRIMPIYFHSDGYNVTAKFEFGNTSDEVITLTSEDLAFSVMIGADDIAKSRIIGEPIQVEPNTIVTFEVNAERDASIAPFMLGEANNHYAFMDFPEWRIKDTTPFNNVNQSMGSSSVGELLEVAGNSKLKYQASGLILTENEKLGKLERKDGKYIAFMKVKVANTSDEDLVVEKIELSWYDLINDQQYIGNITDSEMKPLQDLGLPKVIKANTIAEGLVPLYVSDANFMHSMWIKTNLGDMNFGNYQKYAYWLSLE